MKDILFKNLSFRRIINLTDCLNQNIKIFVYKHLFKLLFLTVIVIVQMVN